MLRCIFLLFVNVELKGQSCFVCMGKLTGWLVHWTPNGLMGSGQAPRGQASGFVPPHSEWKPAGVEAFSTAAGDPPRLRLWRVSGR